MLIHPSGLDPKTRTTLRGLSLPRTLTQLTLDIGVTTLPDMYVLQWFASTLRDLPIVRIELGVHETYSERFLKGIQHLDSALSAHTFQAVLLRIPGSIHTNTSTHIITKLFPKTQDAFFASLLALEFITPGPTSDIDHWEDLTQEVPMPTPIPLALPTQIPITFAQLVAHGLVLHEGGIMRMGMDDLRHQLEVWNGLGVGWSLAKRETLEDMRAEALALLRWAGDVIIKPVHREEEEDRMEIYVE